MKGRLLQNLIVIGLSLVGALLLSEIVLRTMLPPIPSGWGWEDSPLRSPEVNAQADPANELGLRGQKIIYGDDDFVVLLVGDSQVEAVTCAPEDMPEAMLQNALHRITNKPIKVFSLASSGWGQDQQLLALGEYFKRYRADMVLVWATPNNDFWENAFPDRSVTSTAGHLKPTFRLAGSGLTGPFHTPGAYWGHSALLQLLGASIQKAKGNTLEQYVLDTWERDLPPPRDARGTQNSPECANTVPMDQDDFTSNIFAVSADARVTIVTDEDLLNSRSHFATYIAPRSPRDTYLIDITRKLYEAMERSARAHGAIFLAFYPIREDLDLRSGNAIKCVTPRASPGISFPVSLDYLSRLKEVIPAQALIPFELPGGFDLRVSAEDIHLNAAGNERAMRKVATLIAPHVSNE